MAEAERTYWIDRYIKLGAIEIGSCVLMSQVAVRIEDTYIADQKSNFRAKAVRNIASD